MIRKLVIRRFKRFDEMELVFPGHIVLAGPNNCGKTSVLQAIATWALAFDRWRQAGDFRQRRGAYTKVPVARPNFWPVPVRDYALLWPGRDQSSLIEIEIQSQQGWTIPMELLWDTPEQVLVRPRSTVPSALLRSAALAPVFVPAMSGLSREEPLYAMRETVDALLGQARPGEVLRNLLYECSRSDDAWPRLCDSIQRLFNFRLLTPQVGAVIIAEYQPVGARSPLDIASAGSGFQQVLMLLTFLHGRSGAVLLLDEPDAHLHVILQDAIYAELRSVAARRGSQLVIATHSEVIINAVEPRELCILLHRPRMLADVVERRVLLDSLRVLSNEDIMLGLEAPGVLYLEDYTDLEILRAWAEVLDHPARELLGKRLYWRKTVVQPVPGSSGVQARTHYAALQLVRPDLPGLEIVDGDAHPDVRQSEITGSGLQRLRWQRYEVESYLVHPDAIARWVARVVGDAAAPAHLADLARHFEDTYPPPILRDPLGDHPFLVRTKARTELLPPALQAAGIFDVPYTRYAEIARAMLPEEIHPEVREKLDQIVKAFGL